LPKFIALIVILEILNAKLQKNNLERAHIFQVK
jgi:hypothetical protein